MVELEARYEKGGVRKGWIRALAPGTFKLGREPGKADLVAEWDSQISRCHALLTWAEGRLQVRRVLHPKPTINPIYFQNVANDDFTLEPGNEFIIGDTVFALRASDEDSCEALTSKHEVIGSIALSKLALRQMKFHGSGKRQIEALAILPQLLQEAHESITHELLEERAAEVLLEGTPYADAAAVVRLIGTDEPQVELRAYRQRGLGKDDFRPSRTLVAEAVRECRSIPHVWATSARNPEEERQYTSVTGTDWALCVPMREDVTLDWAFYVSGRLPQELKSADSVQKSAELNDALKYAELVGAIFGALRRLLDLQHRYSMFTRFLSPNVLLATNQLPIEEVFKPRPTDIAVLFCDLRGSCGLVEQGRADLMKTWDVVSEALGVMTSAIIEQDGVIGDFQGDAAMGFFGWPKPGGVHPVVQATRAAMNIRKRFSRFALQPGHRLAGFACGIGIAYGPAIAGRLGTPDQFKVGVFGPVVNLAARLESLTRRFRVPILVDEAVRDYLTTTPNDSGARCRKLARVRPAGLSEAVTVSELLPPANVAGERGVMTEANRRLYESALDSFLAGKWAAMPNLERLFPNDGACQLLRDFMTKNAAGPPSGWDGTLAMESK